MIKVQTDILISDYKFHNESVNGLMIDDSVTIMWTEWMVRDCHFYELSPLLFSRIWAWLKRKVSNLCL